MNRIITRLLLCLFEPVCSEDDETYLSTSEKGCQRSRVNEYYRLVSFIEVKYQVDAGSLQIAKMVAVENEQAIST